MLVLVQDCAEFVLAEAVEAQAKKLAVAVRAVARLTPQELAEGVQAAAADDSEEQQVPTHHAMQVIAAPDRSCALP